jgi:ubiquitin C-terminal hydrolase
MVGDIESEDEAKVSDSEMHENEPDENFEYKLVGVQLHMGTAEAGHYLSYININRNSLDSDKPEWLLTDKDKWLEFNDS